MLKEEIVLASRMRCYISTSLELLVKTLEKWLCYEMASIFRYLLLALVFCECKWQVALCDPRVPYP